MVAAQVTISYLISLFGLIRMGLDEGNQLLPQQVVRLGLVLAAGNRRDEDGTGECSKQCSVVMVRVLGGFKWLVDCAGSCEYYWLIAIHITLATGIFAVAVFRVSGAARHGGLVDGRMACWV